MTYTIKLQQFEGPFDLLLFFIERDELDIYDIPIAQITKDFLDYIQQLESMNIDLASEFILVAASLMRIKSKMLLPRKELDEEGNEIDPREELVARLLEYRRYKGILEEMRALEESRAKRADRGYVSEELQSLANQALADAELESLTLFRLMKAFDQVMQDWKQARIKKVHTVLNYKYSIQDQRERIQGLLRKGNKTNFASIFEVCEDRMHAIVTFLSLLEMANRHEIHLIEGEGVNHFWVMPKDEEEE
jgi:segregation and condensation protein A